MDTLSPIYKISYVILPRGSHPGSIVNTNERPVIGDVVILGNQEFIIEEIIDLLPTKGKFHYLHVTCRAKEEN